jgi:hypothetical protein
LLDLSIANCCSDETRIVAALSAIVIAVAVIEVIEKDKAYNVKLNCMDCPFAEKESETKVV